METKVCSRCKEEKPTTEFYKKSGGGLRSYCKDCSKAMCSAYHKQNRDKIIERKRKYHKEHRSEIADYNHRYSEEHSAANTQRAKRWAEEHRDRHHIHQVMYQERTRADKFGVKSDYSISDWQECKDFFTENGIVHCAYCGKPLIQGITQDHVVPMCSGGQNIKSNIVPACNSCNASKANLDLRSWFINQPFYVPERMERIEEYCRTAR